MPCFSLRSPQSAPLFVFCRPSHTQQPQQLQQHHSSLFSTTPPSLRVAALSSAASTSIAHTNAATSTGSDVVILSRRKRAFKSGQYRLFQQFREPQIGDVLGYLSTSMAVLIVSISGSTLPPQSSNAISLSITWTFYMRSARDVCPDL